MKSLGKVIIVSILFLVVNVACNSEDTKSEVIEEYLVDTSLVETNPIEIVSINVAVGGASIKKNPSSVVLKGICWSTTPNPKVNINDQLYYSGPLDNYKISLLNLKENTTYYARAFVKVSATLYYGNEVSFTTKTFEKIYTEGEGVTDIDGNEYKTVILGTLEWMAENLRTTKFNDGTEITSGIWRHDSDAVHKIYGSYYNWDNINNSKKICPTGWRVPNEKDCDLLLEHVDPIFYKTNNVAAIKLKSSGYVENSTGLWLKTEEGIGGTNESGFNAVPSSLFNFTTNDFLFGIGYEFRFWTADGVKNSKGEDTPDAVSYYISNYSNQVTKHFRDKKLTGISCRCVKE